MHEIKRLIAMSYITKSIRKCSCGKKCTYDINDDVKNNFLFYVRVWSFAILKGYENRINGGKSIVINLFSL